MKKSNTNARTLGAVTHTHTHTGVLQNIQRKEEAYL